MHGENFDLIIGDAASCWPGALNYPIRGLEFGRDEGGAGKPVTG